MLLKTKMETADRPVIAAMLASLTGKGGGGGGGQYIVVHAEILGCPPTRWP